MLIFWLLGLENNFGYLATFQKWANFKSSYHPGATEKVYKFHTPVL